jgi:hypothetical protein
MLVEPDDAGHGARIAEGFLFNRLIGRVINLGELRFRCTMAGHKIECNKDVPQKEDTPFNGEFSAEEAQQKCIWPFRRGAVTPYLDARVEREFSSPTDSPSFSCAFWTAPAVSSRPDA